MQLGANDDEEKKLCSLLKGMAAEDVTMEIALQLLSFPKRLANILKPRRHHRDERSVWALHQVWNGIEVTARIDLAFSCNVARRCSHLLAQPKTIRGRQAAAPKPPLQTFAESPVTGNPVQLLDGRYGPYVTDGETNASIPKGTEASAVTLEMALELLAERAAAGWFQEEGSWREKGSQEGCRIHQESCEVGFIRNKQGSYEKEGDENCQEVFAESGQEVGQRKNRNRRMMSEELNRSSLQQDSYQFISRHALASGFRSFKTTGR